MGEVVMCLKDLLVEKACQIEVDNEAVEIMSDPFHLFVAADPTKTPQHLTNQCKGSTFRVLREEVEPLRTRTSVLWSQSYDVGSVGHVSEERVKK